MRLNITATFANLLLGVFVGAFLTPFLVIHLGTAHFGLISLTSALVSYFSVFSQTFSAAINRNLTFAIHDRDHVKAQQVYFTSLAGTGLVIAILGLPLTLLSFNIASLVNVPAGAEGEIRILSFSIAGAFLLSIASLPFQSVSFANNKTYLGAVSLALQNAVRLALTVALVLFIAASLVSVGLAIMFSSVASFVFIVFASFRVAPWLDPTKRAFDRLEFRNLFQISADIFIMQLGTVALMSSELVAVNLLFGDHAGGRYAAVVALAFMLRNAITSLAALAAPVIIAEYARADMTAVAKSTIYSMKCIAVAVALPAGFLAAAASEILAVWLGADFSSSAGLLALQALALALSSVVVPLYSVCLAAKRIWIPGVVQIFCAMTFVGCAWLGAHLLAGPLAMACLFLGIYVTKELGFMIPYSARCIGIAPYRLAGPVLYSIALFLVAYVCTSALIEMWSSRSWAALIVIGMAVTVPYAVAAWLLATADDRAATMAMVNNKDIVPQR